MADLFSRKKMLWLNGIFFQPSLPATACRVAYTIADHLNARSGDAWPSLRRIAGLIGVSTKTVRRAVVQLETAGVIRVKRSTAKGRSHRYEPIFGGAADADKNGHHGGQIRASPGGAVVPQSYLKNPLRTYLAGQVHPQSSSRARNDGRRLSRRGSSRPDRGRLECEVAARLGPNGMEILFAIAAADGRVVDKLCDAFADGTLSDAQLNEAKLIIIPPLKESVDD